MTILLFGTHQLLSWQCAELVKHEDLKNAKLQIGPARKLLKRFQAGGDIYNALVINGRASGPSAKATSLHKWGRNLLNKFEGMDPTIKKHLLTRPFDLLASLLAPVPFFLQRPPTKLPLIGWPQHPRTCRLTRPHMFALAR